jgi:hypothetical protein
VKEAPTPAAAEVRQAGLVGTATGLAKLAIARAEPKARELFYTPQVDRLPVVPAEARELFYSPRLHIYRPSTTLLCSTVPSAVAT